MLNQVYQKYILYDINIEWENNKLSTFRRVHSIYEPTWVPVYGSKTLTDRLWTIVHFLYKHSIKCNVSMDHRLWIIVYGIQVVYKIKDFKGWKKPRTFLSDNIDSRIHRIKWRIRHSIYVVPFIAIFWTTGRSIYIIGTLSYIKIQYFETVFSQFLHAQQSPSKPSSSWTYLSLSDLLFLVTPLLVHVQNLIFSKLTVL